MTRTTIVIAAALALAATLPAIPAQAQAARTFVSAAGSDSNNCLNVDTPCRHFATAFAATGTNGEIYVLDPANYGSLTITHGVSIQGHGWGSIAPPSSGNAITINAPSTDAVNLDGLTIDGAGFTSTGGIVFNSGKSLTVENCVVRKVTSDGLQLFSNATTRQNLTVSNSYFTDNGGSGVDIETLNSGAVKVSIDRTGFYGNAIAGLAVEGNNGTGTLTVAVTDSVAANNGIGFTVQSQSGSSVTNLSLTHSQAVDNGPGVEVSGTNATLWLAQSTVTGSNNEGYLASLGGTIMSYGDNYLAAANGAPFGSLTPATKQ